MSDTWTVPAASVQHHLLLLLTWHAAPTGYDEPGHPPSTVPVYWGSAESLARECSLPLDVVEATLRELEARGLITPGHWLYAPEEELGPVPAFLVGAR